MMYTLYLQVNYPEHGMHVQSGLYRKQVKRDAKFRYDYDYLRAKFSCGLGMQKFDVGCGCILFNAETNAEKHSYFKLLTVKQATVEEAKTLS